MDTDTALDEAARRPEQQAGCILIPLDGSPSAERALPAAEKIACATGATLLLLRTVPPLAWAEHLGPGAMSPQMYQQLLDDEQRMARNYLEDLASPLRQRGLDVRTRVECGDSQAHLLAAVEELRPMLLVLAAADCVAPGGLPVRGGTDRAPDELDSIARKVVTVDAVPVLVVPSPVYRAQAAFPVPGQQSKW
ncbi:MAG TPA: universal stress protein [Ktedonobacterales bacterium]